jgi:hypothetical protein
VESLKLEDSSLKPAHLQMDPFWKGFGAAMSSSPWEWLWNGDEDVATPLHAGAVLWEEFEDWRFKFEAEAGLET